MKQNVKHMNRQPLSAMKHNRIPHDRRQKVDDANERRRCVSLQLALKCGACVLLACSAFVAAQQSDPNGAGQCRASGLVVGVDGQGLSGALIQVLWSRNPAFDTNIMNVGVSMIPRTYERQEIARSRTDADGAFQLSLPAWFKTMRPSKSVLLVSKNGYGTTSVAARCLFGQQSPVIVLGAAEEISGSIIDEHCAPVKGARVSVLCSHVELANACTDGRGSFRIGGLKLDRDDTVLNVGGTPRGLGDECGLLGGIDPRDVYGGCCTRASIFVSRSSNDLGTWVIPIERVTPLRITLPRGYSKAVRIVDAANKPLRSSSVVLFAKNALWNETFTDANGDVVVEGITEEPISISCMDPICKVGPGLKTVVVCEEIRQFPLDIVDADTGAELFDVIIYSRGDLATGAFLGKDWWRSGDKVTFKTGHHHLSFMTEGYEPWSGTVSVDYGTQDLKIRLKKKM